MNIVERNIDKIKRLCNEYKVAKLYLFGSSLNDKFNNESDIDFIVTSRDVELIEYADNYFDFKFSLEDLLQRQIDLLEEKSIRNPFLKKSINSSQKLIK